MRLDVQNYTQLKKYFSGIDSIKWAYQNYLKGISFQNLVRERPYQEQHNEIILGGLPKLFTTKVPRENVSKEDIKVKRVSIKMGDKSFPASKVWESLIDKIPTWIKTNPYIVNLNSSIGEEALKGGSFLVEHIQRVFKENNQKLKLRVLTGAELDYTFKEFSDSDSSISNLANVDLLVIFSYNSLSSSDWNKARLQALFEECHLKNTVVILTSKSESKFIGFKYLNIPLSDNFKNEEALLKDLGL